VKFLVLADIDDFRWKHGPGRADAVLSCGDVPDAVISEAARAHGNPPVFAVKGNHDPFEEFLHPIVDLHLQIRECGGLRFGGLCGSWRYKPVGHYLYDQDEVDFLMAGFPEVDIFLSHNSPRGIHDRDDGVHIGFEALTAYIERTGPRLLVHGHQHLNQETQSGKTRIVGVHGYKMIEIS
jgi:Icc-related predicted phosphoesterase